MSQLDLFGRPLAEPDPSPSVSSQSSPAPQAAPEVPADPAPASVSSQSSPSVPVEVPEAEVKVVEVAASPSMPSRWVVCPATITGSMDAEEVDPASWERTAQRMANRTKGAVDFFEISAGGQWNKRGSAQPEAR